MKVLTHVTVFLTLLSTVGCAQRQTDTAPEQEPEKIYMKDASLDVQIGQMIMIGIGDRQKFSEDDPLLNDLQAGYAGGIIYYEKNVDRDSPKASMRGITLGMQKNARIPLFVSIDEEGGKVNRLKTQYGYRPTRSARELALLSNRDSSLHYARNIVMNMYDVGINLNYAPDVDLEVSLDNPIIAKVERSYGRKASDVTRQAEIVIQAHHEKGIGTVLKHFPGHGSSKSDTHLGIADVTDFWQFEELFPYKALIDSGVVDGIMTAHIVNANLDERKVPATLSKNVVTGMLRNFMGYKGVIFSDDMQMQAITSYYGFDKAVKEAILAGVDVLMFANNVPGSENVTVKELHGTIKRLVESGEISRERINESFARIIDLKQKLGLLEEDYLVKLEEQLR